MNERQQNLLKIIISEYIKTAEPVSSKFIAEAGKFDLSSATIRNEMMDLEDQGYIFHPHTSAGRIPTEIGYRLYVDAFSSDFPVAKKYEEVLSKVINKSNKLEPQAIKKLAKEIAELADNAVFVAFSPHDFYYTGLSNLFSQPEFIQHELVSRLSQVIDHLDNVISKIYKMVGREIKISIGSQNPFAQDCGSVLAKYNVRNVEGILGIIGPMRMDYKNSASLVKCGRELINNLGN